MYDKSAKGERYLNESWWHLLCGDDNTYRQWQSSDGVQVVVVDTASAGAAGTVVRTFAAGQAARDCSGLDVVVGEFASESLAVKPELLVESADCHLC